MFRDRFPLLSAAVVLLSVAGLPAQQQAASGRAPTRVPVTVVLVDRLPTPDAPFMIQRRADLTPRDVILLRSDATREQFAEAVRSLLTIRQVGGDTATSSATMRMRPSPAQRFRPRREFPWVQRVLSDLRRADFKDVAGIGRVRAVEIWLPPQGRPGQGRRATP